MLIYLSLFVELISCFDLFSSGGGGTFQESDD